jgi:DNA-binding NtrC family response regulator
MVPVLERLRRVAPSALPVLVTGETGVGKELAADALHRASSRRRRPFLALNCGALAASLVESELFGHVKGAFTGATADRPGLFESASGGTLFLDEIGELPLELQPRLLRVLEARAVRPIGAAHEVEVDVRVVAATHRDLAAMVAAGRFREDLFHRLAIVTVTLPPLRARPEDITFLARRLLAARAPERRLSAAAEARLTAYAWPGNVRELRNVIERAVVLGDGPTLDVDALELPEPTPILPMIPPTANTSGPRDEPSMGSEEPIGPEPRRPSAEAARRAMLRALRELTLDEERALLLSTVEACGGNRARAARRLGISRSALHARLKRLGVPSGPEPRLALC